MPHTKQVVIEYLEYFIKQEAITMLYEGKDVSHVKEAHELIARAFDNLDTEYGQLQNTRTQENTAR